MHARLRAYKREKLPNAIYAEPAAGGLRVSRAREPTGIAQLPVW